MASDPSQYNYEHFSFALEPGEFERWLANGPALGAAAPEFRLSDVSGVDHHLADLRGRPVVIEFGSYTCPIFCAQIGPMEALADEHPEAVFLVIYTREAHPGEATPAHHSNAEKVATAGRLVDNEHLRRTVLVDDFEGTVHRAYGGAWDAVFVLDRQGRVVLRRAWNAPDDVRAVLSALARGDEPGEFESIEMTPTMGRGGFGHGLLRGGAQALVDFYQSAPPPVRERLEASESAEVRAIVADL
jgi:peroxiredoxin